jgi:type II secretory pathway pseudopilin PulG
VRKGTGVVLGVFIVALLMGLATWPLLKIRRQKEIRRTEALLQALKGACEQYSMSHKQYPRTLADLKLGGEPYDAWRRPIHYAVINHGRPGIAGRDYIQLWSDGPDLSTSSDDIRVGD